jgi:hypothetical protein
VIHAIFKDEARSKTRMPRHTSYRTLKVDGLSIFYREAGSTDLPALLLLHGLPSSSRMFEPLFSRLADRYHLVAPDYPGFGHSDWPDPRKFAYTFDNYAGIMNRFTESVGLARYVLYMQGLQRSCGVPYGAGPSGEDRGHDHPGCRRAQRRTGGKLEAKASFLGGSSCQRKQASNESPFARDDADPAHRQRSKCGMDDPDLWTDEFAFLNQPGQADIQSDLFYDYRTNVESYPKWQAWMRETQPRLLVIWGK